jgi:hypothetical protein
MSAASGVRVCVSNGRDFFTHAYPSAIVMMIGARRVISRAVICSSDRSSQSTTAKECYGSANPVPCRRWLPSVPIVRIPGVIDNEWAKSDRIRTFGRLSSESLTGALWRAHYRLDPLFAIAAHFTAVSVPRAGVTKSRVPLRDTHLRRGPSESRDRVCRLPRSSAPASR